ncbi:MAG: DUF362 domain-containing protein [Candidatus Latescibacterota bacterium]
MTDARKYLNPMVADHPDAVFLMKTHLESMEDPEGFEKAGARIARALFKTPADPSAGLPPPLIKPNVVNGTMRDKQGRVLATDGVVTDVHFLGGIARHLSESGFSGITIAEGGDPVRGQDGEYSMDQTFLDRGYRALADRMGFSLVGLNKETYLEDDLVWRHLGEDGVVFKEIPFVRPLPGDFTINVPTLKTHYHAVVSLCGKNLQGAVAVGYRHHCEPIERVRQYPPEKRAHFQPNVENEIARLAQKHDREGYWRMNVGYEWYAQRTCDTILALKPQPTMNIIEGIRGRDGTAFHRGQDYLTNLVIAGVNPVHVDTIASYLMGQTPRAVVAYLKIAEERGLGTCDPFAIPTYRIEEDGTFESCDRLSDWRIQPSLDVLAGNGSLRNQEQG